MYVNVYVNRPLLQLLNSGALASPEVTPCSEILHFVQIIHYFTNAAAHQNGANSRGVITDNLYKMQTHDHLDVWNPNL